MARETEHPAKKKVAKTKFKKKTATDKNKASRPSPETMGVLRLLDVLRSRGLRVALKLWQEDLRHALVFIELDRNQQVAFKKAGAAALENGPFDWNDVAAGILTDVLAGTPRHTIELLSPDILALEPNDAILSPKVVPVPFFLGPPSKKLIDRRDHSRQQRGVDARHEGDEEKARTRRRRTLFADKDEEDLANELPELLVARQGRDDRYDEGADGYVVPDDDSNPEGRDWVPRKGQERLLVAVLRHWGLPGTDSYATLATKLNKDGFRSASGRLFTKFNVVRLLIAAELLRGSAWTQG